MVENVSWLEDYLNEMRKKPVLENFLELQSQQLSLGKSIYTLKVLDKHSNFYGFVHGGTFSSLADVAMGAACTTFGKRVVTIDMNIHFIKNTKIGSTLTAVGQVIDNGRTVMRAQAEIWNEQQKLLVRTQAAFMVIGKLNQTEHVPLHQAQARVD